MACKEYSAVFLSLWINKDKTPVRVKCLVQLNVCPMLNLKGRGVRGGSGSSRFFWLQFQWRFQWKMCSAHGLWMFQRSGWPHQSTSSPAFVQAAPGLSGLEISESSAYQTGGGVRDGKAKPHTQSSESITATLWLWSDTSSQKQEKLFLSHRASAVPGTLQKGRSSFWEAEGQQGVPGWAGRVCLWARFSKGKTESYPKVIFLSMDRVQQAPVCQAKQYKMNPGTAAAREPQLAHPAWPGMLCLQSWELSRAVGSLLECKPDMKFAHLKYHSLQ